MSEHEMITKKVAANEVYKTNLFYGYFMYVGLVMGFVTPLIYITSTKLGVVAIILNTAVFMFGVWITNAKKNALKAKYNL